MVIIDRLCSKVGSMERIKRTASVGFTVSLVPVTLVMEMMEKAFYRVYHNVCEMTAKEEPESVLEEDVPAPGDSQGDCDTVGSPPFLHFGADSVHSKELGLERRIRYTASFQPREKRAMIKEKKKTQDKARQRRMSLFVSW